MSRSRLASVSCRSLRLAIFRKLPPALFALATLAPLPVVADTTLGTASAGSQPQLDALGALTFSNGTLSLTQTGEYAFGAGVVLDPGTQNVIAATGSAALTLGAADPLTIDGGRLTVNAAAGTQNTLTGNLTLANDGVFEKSGSGVLTLEGRIDTPDGATAASIDQSAILVNAGTLRLAQDNALPAVSVSIASGSTLDTGVTTQTLHQLSGSGALSGSGVLTLDNSAGDTTFSGATNLARATLVKTGSDTLTLNGATVAFGGLDVQGGTLALAGTAAKTTSAIAGSAAGTLVFDGTLNATSLSGSPVITGGSASVLNVGSATLGAGTDIDVQNFNVTDRLTLVAPNALATSIGSKHFNGVVDLGGLDQWFNVSHGVIGSQIVNPGAVLGLDGYGYVQIGAMPGSGQTTLRLAGSSILMFNGDTSAIGRVEAVDGRNTVLTGNLNLASAYVDTNAILNFADGVHHVDHFDGDGTVTLEGHALLYVNDLYQNTRFSAASLGFLTSASIVVVGSAQLGDNITGFDVGGLTIEYLAHAQVVASRFARGYTVINGELDAASADLEFYRLYGYDYDDSDPNYQTSRLINLGSTLTIHDLGHFEGAMIGSGATTLYADLSDGSLELTDNDLSALGGIVLQRGRLAVTGQLSLASNVVPDLAAGTTFDLGGGTQILAGFTGSGTVNIGAGGLLTLRDAGSGIVFNNALRLTGPGALHIDGDLTLTDQYTMTGALTVDSGTLTLGRSGALATAASVTVAGGATLDLAGVDQTFGGLNGSGSILVGSGSSTLTLNVVASAAFDGALSGSGYTLVKSGSGAQTLGSIGTPAAVSINAGTLRLTQDDGLTTGVPVTVLAGAALDLVATHQSVAGFTGSGTVNVDAGGTLVLAPGTGNTRALNVTLSGGGTLAVADGTLALNVATTLGGTVSVAGGARLDLLADDALAGTANVDVASGATLNLGGRSQTLGALSGAGHVDADLAALTLNVASGSASFTGDISGTYALTKTGAGTQVLGGSTGTLTALSVTAGTLRFAQSGALSLATAVSVDAGAMLDLAATAQTVGGIDGSGRVNVDAGGTLTVSSAADSVLNVTLSGAGGFQVGGAGLHLRAPLALAGPVSISSGASLTLEVDEALAASSGVTVGSSATLYASGTQTLHGLAGSGDVIVNGLLRLDPGSGQTLTTAVSMQGYDGSSLNGSLFIASGDVRLSGATSVFAGTASIAAGATLELVSDGALLALGGVDIASGGRLIARGSQLLAGLRGSGTLQIGHQGSAGYVPGELLYESDSDAVFDGTLTGAGSTLEKQGSGQLRLNGDASGLTGPASVYEGRLSINGSYGGSVTVYDGGRLGGTGTILGGVDVAEGGMLDPGNSIGTLTLGSLTLQPGSVLRIEADSNGNTDAIVATGDITIDGATLLLVPIDGTLGAGLTYTVLSAGGGVIGQFAEVISSLPLLGLTATYLPSSAGFGLDGGGGVGAIRVTVPTPDENAAISPVDPIAGGPGGLLQRMTGADAEAGLLFDPQQAGIDNGESDVGVSVGRFRADGYTQRWENFPLQYAWKLDSGAVAVVSLPITSLDTDGRGRNLRLRSIAPGAGLKLPLADGWQIKPMLRWGTVVDDDYNHVGSLVSAALTSHFVAGSEQGLRFGMDNLVGLYRSIGGNVHGLDAGYELHETALRNSVRLEGPLDGSFLGSGARWRLWATDTRYFGDRLATPSNQEIGFSASTRVRAGASVDQVVNLGMSFTRTEGGGHAAQLNFGYRF